MDIKLSEPIIKGTKSIEECIILRESVRDFKDKSVEVEKISQLLWAGQGRKGNKKTVPSAGGTYPLELYVIIKDKGIYRYDSNKHLLKLIKEGNFNNLLARASHNQQFIENAPLNFVICAEFNRTCNKYGERGVRYVFIEIGHAGQNIELEAIALGLDSVPVGAFHDEEVKKILALPESIEPLYIIPIGYKK